jgi:small GTP-binding protein
MLYSYLCIDVYDPATWRATWDQYFPASLMIDDQMVDLALWDSDVQDAFRPLTYSHTDIFLLVYSITNLSSFENIKLKWLPEIKMYAPNTPFMLVGTKLDSCDDAVVQEQLQAKGMEMVSTEQGQQLAVEIGAQGAFECSAPTKHGLTEIFERAAEVSLLKRKQNQPDGPLPWCCTIT